MSTTHTTERLDGRAHHRLNRPAMAMQKNTLLSIAKPLGCRIDCLAGSLWITRDGDPHDTLLSAGEHHVAEGRPRLIVQALEAGVVRIASRGLSASAN